MTRGQRRTHLIVWLVLAFTLPLALAGALLARAPQSDAATPAMGNRGP